MAVRPAEGRVGTDDPNPHGYFSVHACEPEVVGGKFGFGGQPYKWALLFTAESVASNSSNQLGIAFANNPAGPWTPDLTPIVQTDDDFGHNQYPFDCPPDLVLPRPTSGNRCGPSGHILVTYMSNAGSPGTDMSPGEGLVLRELNLSDVPASGPCPQCFVVLPNGKKIEAVPTAGLVWPPDDASIAYDAATGDIVISYDGGPPNVGRRRGPSHPVGDGCHDQRERSAERARYVACSRRHRLVPFRTLAQRTTRIVRLPDGDMPNGQRVVDAVHGGQPQPPQGAWGSRGYRIWSLDTPLRPARACCRSPPPATTARGTTS